MKDLKFKNKEGFTTPKNYFDQLEESIINETKSFGEGSSFDIPEGYFESLEAKILDKNKTASIKKVRRLWVAISSVAACIVVAGFFYFQSVESKDQTQYIVDQNTYEEVDSVTEEDVYESLYKTYFVEEDIKKSPNDISLDDLDKFYSDQQLSRSR